MLDIELFEETLRKKNILKIRLMMKNSLLYDSSFKSFDEMEKLAEKYKVNIWQDSSVEVLIKRDKPWTIDDVNYELTAIVSSFTKERIAYLKDLITDVYNSDIYMNENTSNHNKKDKNDSNKINYERKLISDFLNIQLLINDARRDKSINLSADAWQNINLSKGVINDVKNFAYEIIHYCDQLSGSKEDVNHNKKYKNDSDKINCERKLISDFLKMQLLINGARRDKSINLSVATWQNINLSKRVINNVKKHAYEIIYYCDQLSGSEEDGNI